MLTSNKRSKKPKNSQYSRHNKKDRRRPGATGQPPESIQSDGHLKGKSNRSSEKQPDALPLEEYAKKYNFSESEVWKKLRSGQLFGRTQRGRLMIHGSAEAVGNVAEGKDTAAGEVNLSVDLPPTVDWGPKVELSNPPQPEIPKHSFDLPPIPPGLESQDSEHKPGASMVSSEVQENQAGGFLTLSGERTNSPEIALLLDHLSLAKEENREILKMTQESIKKVTKLSDSLIEMKDSVIEAKDDQIQALKEKISGSNKEISKLKQENEDLEMLAKTLSD